MQHMFLLESPVNTFLTFKWESSLMRITYPSLLALALAVASCGGGGDSPGTTTAAGTSSTGSQSTGSGASTGTAASGTTGSTGADTGATSGTGTGTGSTGTTATPPRAASGLIEYHGDSTVHGYLSGSENNGGSPQQVDTPAPVTFAQRLDSARFKVENKGVNGTSACDLVGGRNGLTAWAQQMASSTARYVIINHAINDLRQGAGTARYRTCLEQLNSIAKTNGKTVIFETPNPIVPEGLGNYVTVMRNVANENAIPVIDQYAYLTGYLNGQNASKIVPDGLHPSQDVYTMKGEFAAREFQRYFP
jgi:lysophospholipase L1-like esterase